MVSERKGEEALELILFPHGVDFAIELFLSSFFGLFWMETDHVIGVIDKAKQFRG